MKKEKFIDKLLFEQYGVKYLARQKGIYVKEFEDTKETIVKAMKYHNWSMFACGTVVGVFIIILIAQFL